MIHKNAVENLPPDVRATLARYNRGSDLATLMSLPGWNSVLEILQEIIQEAEEKVLKFKDVNPQELFLLHAKKQGMKDMLNKFESELASCVALTNDPPAKIQHLLTKY